MKNRATLLLLTIVLCSGLGNAFSFEEEKNEWKSRGYEGGEETFLLQRSKHVVRTDAGEMTILRSNRGSNVERPMDIGFITMEPNSLFIPQYIDSSLIIFIRSGEAKIGWVCKDELEERNLKRGDVYRIPAGSAFYLVNTEKHTLQLICSIETSETFGWSTFKSFYLGGGTYPTSILGGFSPHTLTSAFNVSMSELSKVLTRQEQGPIVFLNHPQSRSSGKNFMQLKEQDRLQHLKKMVKVQVGSDTEELQQTSGGSLRSIFNSMIGEENKRNHKPSDICNLYDKTPNFKNNYGWTVAIDKSHYSPLKHSGASLYLINLHEGSMMAPHVNPTATEYGIVLRGSGTIQIVFPNGTCAMNAEVKEGDAFWIPRYFPFCQIASQNSPLEFFGFTTSARKNRPQFLVGRNSVLRSMRATELADSFGVSKTRLKKVLNAQRESIILPLKSSEDWEQKKKKKKRVDLESFGREMI